MFLVGGSMFVYTVSVADGTYSAETARASTTTLHVLSVTLICGAFWIGAVTKSMRLDVLLNLLGYTMVAQNAWWGPLSEIESINAVRFTLLFFGVTACVVPTVKWIRPKLRN